ncbi:MAG: choice-of-anchor L domain-containing protein [Proteobacteria bacterium]|nr:choice-of-anchor L domain-containing protein [Pseudomonadota bacterium]
MAFGVFSDLVDASGNLLDSGIVLSSGDVNDLPGDIQVENRISVDNSSSNTDDAQLDTIGTNLNQNDVATYTLNFDLTDVDINKLVVIYAWGTDEQEQWGVGNFNDLFGVFVTGGGTVTAVDEDLADHWDGVDTTGVPSAGDDWTDNTTTDVDPNVELNYMTGVTNAVVDISTLATASLTVNFSVADQGDSSIDSAAFISYFGSSLLIDANADDSSETASSGIGDNYGYETNYSIVDAIESSVVDTDVSITNYDAAVANEVTSATITLSTASGTANDYLHVNGTLPAGITASAVGGVGSGITTITLTGNATAADYETALKLITFGTDGDVTTVREIEIVLTDADTNSNMVSTFVNVTNISIPIVDAIAPTVDSTPTLTGTFDSSASALVVEVNGVDYTLGTDPEITSPSAGTWSLTIPGANQLSAGTYDVTVTTNGTVIDNTNSELVVLIDAVDDNNTTDPGNYTVSQDATISVAAPGVLGNDLNANLLISPTVDWNFDASTDPDADGVWYEDGTSFNTDGDLVFDDLVVTIVDGGTTLQTTADLSSLVVGGDITQEYIQVVAAYNRTSSFPDTDFLNLYINGILVSTNSTIGVDDFDDDGTALGTTNGSTAVAGYAAGAVTNFEGDIAIFRSYAGQSLVTSEVTQNFLAVSSGGLSLSSVNGSAANIGTPISTFDTGLGANGDTVTVNNDGSFTFDPGSDFDYLLGGASTTATFTYSITDALGNASDTATVTITITGVNDAPTASNVTTGVTQTTGPVSINVQNATDPDSGDTITYTIDSGSLPSGLTFTNGVLGGTATAAASSTITVLATDAEGATTTYDVLVNVTATATSLEEVIPDEIFNQESSDNGNSSPNYESSGLTVDGEEVLEAVADANNDNFSTSRRVVDNITAEINPFDLEGVVGFSISFKLTELGSEDPNSVSTLFPLRAGIPDVETKDQLIVRSLLRDSVVFVEVDYTINSDPNLVATEIIVRQLNGDPLPDWLRVNDQGRLISGVPPIGMENIELRIEVRLSNDTVIVRYVDVNVSTGGIASLQESSEEMIAGNSLFENQIEKEAVKFQNSSDDIVKSLIN